VFEIVGVVVAGAAGWFGFPWSPDKTFLRFAWSGEVVRRWTHRANVRARWKEDPSKTWWKFSERTAGSAFGGKGGESCRSLMQPIEPPSVRNLVARDQAAARRKSCNSRSRRKLSSMQRSSMPYSAMSWLGLRRLAGLRAMSAERVAATGS